jgi:hypothetical protein
MVKPPELGNPTVFYINRYTDPNPGLVGRMKNSLTGHKHRYRRDDEPFSTSITLPEIANFEDERIQDALWRQHEGSITESNWVIIPVIFANRALSHILSVPRRPIELRSPQDDVEAS